MNFQTIIDQFLLLANKDQSGNAISPAEASIAAGMASMELLRKLCGLYEEYRPGMPIPRVSAEVTQSNMDHLDQLKVERGGLGPDDQPALIVDANGFATKPTDYFSCLGLSAFKMVNGKPIESRNISILREQEWKARNTFRLFKRQTETYPYCRFRGGVIEFAPKNIGVVHMSYIRYPLDPFYDYYVDSNEIPHYIPPGTTYVLQPGDIYRDGTSPTSVVSISQEFEFPQSLYPNLSSIILGYVSGNLRDNFLKQLSEMRKDKGM